jgi:hypothetical protein
MQEKVPCKFPTDANDGHGTLSLSRLVVPKNMLEHFATERYSLEMVPESVCENITRLILADLHFSDAEFMELKDFVDAPKCQKLKVLDISWNNFCSDKFWDWVTKDMIGVRDVIVCIVGNFDGYLVRVRLNDLTKLSVHVLSKLIWLDNEEKYPEDRFTSDQNDEIRAAHKAFYCHRFNELVEQI